MCVYLIQTAQARASGATQTNTTSLGEKRLKWADRVAVASQSKPSPLMKRRSDGPFLNVTRTDRCTPPPQPLSARSAIRTVVHKPTKDLRAPQPPRQRRSQPSHDNRQKRAATGPVTQSLGTNVTLPRHRRPSPIHCVHNYPGTPAEITRRRAVQYKCALQMLQGVSASGDRGPSRSETRRRGARSRGERTRTPVCTEEPTFPTLPRSHSTRGFPASTPASASTAARDRRRPMVRNGAASIGTAVMWTEYV
jgi:hypothetical protein